MNDDDESLLQLLLRYEEQGLNLKQIVLEITEHECRRYRAI